MDVGLLREQLGRVQLFTDLPQHVLMTSEPVVGVTRVLLFSQTHQVIPASISLNLDVASFTDQRETGVPVTPHQVITGNIAAITGGRQIRVGEVIVHDDTPVRVGIANLQSEGVL